MYVIADFILSFSCDNMLFDNYIIRASFVSFTVMACFIIIRAYVVWADFVWFLRRSTIRRLFNRLIF